MCSPARCRTCGKTTWSGCGQHVDQVMRNVPTDQQCTCTADDHAPGRAGAEQGRRSFGARLLGR